MSGACDKLSKTSKGTKRAQSNQQIDSTQIDSVPIVLANPVKSQLPDSNLSDSHRIEAKPLNRQLDGYHSHDSNPPVSTPFTSHDTLWQGSSLPSVESAVVVFDSNGVIRFATKSAESVLGVQLVLNARIQASKSDTIASRFVEVIQDRRRVAMKAIEASSQSSFDDQICILDPTSGLPVLVCRFAIAADGTTACTLMDSAEHRRVSYIAQSVDNRLRHVQKMEALGQLASGVAHDFNNLLTAIRGHVSLARSTLPKRHPAIENLGHVEQAAAQAAGVVNALMTFGRGAPGFSRTIPARQIVDAVEGMFRRTISPRINFEVRYTSETELFVNADPHLIQQALLNLLINARDAISERLSIEHEPGSPSRGSPSRGSSSRSTSSRGSPKPADMYSIPYIGSITLSIEHDVDAARVLFVVADNGTGISPEHVARIFEPFFTTKPRGQGTGLGLSIVHAIVDEHSGTIDVDSTSGIGTTFTIRLLASSDTTEPRSPLQTIARETRYSGTALVVEPNQLVCGLIVSMLESIGFTTRTAQDGKQAIAALKVERQITLAVIAHHLSDTDVGKLLKAFRETSPTLACLIISNDDELPVAIKHLSSIVLIKKPFDVMDFSAAIAHLSQLGSTLNTAVSTSSLKDTVERAHIESMPARIPAAEGGVN